jgi:hypothetical protein
MYQHSVICSWACLWPKCIIFVCLWDTLYRDSHKHAPYIPTFCNICSWACLWPKCIIFMCLWAETPHIGVFISTPRMYQHSVMCSWACLWPKCIISVCLWLMRHPYRDSYKHAPYETPHIGILISTPRIYVPTFCNMLMGMLMTKVHNLIYQSAHYNR